MSTTDIESELKRKVSEKVRLEQEGHDRFRVFTPFRFNDGDHLAIVLKSSDNGWELSDEGHTLMHLSYQIDMGDLKYGTRKRVIEGVVSQFHLSESGGVFSISVENQKYGDALFTFVQALIHIFDVLYLSREQVKSTFLEDFHRLFVEKVPLDRVTFDWNDPVSDPDGLYTVDCKINSMAKPLYAFAVTNDDKCKNATITILRYEKMGVPFQSMAIFEDVEKITTKALARLMDVVEKQFSSLTPNKDRISDYLKEKLLTK